MHQSIRQKDLKFLDKAVVVNITRTHLLKALSQIKGISIKLIEHDAIIFESKNEYEKQLEITIHRKRFFGWLFFRGCNGLAESYTLGDWDCTDLPLLMHSLSNQIHLSELMENVGFAALRIKLVNIVSRCLPRSLRKDQSMIQWHYDLGNAFFQKMLDDTMSYSCAYFKTPDTSLKDASLYKIARIANKLSLDATCHVLEIGCGWGALACYLAKNYGCKVTCVTLSQAQYVYVTDLIQSENLAHKISVFLKDYRLLKGQFDRIVSVEMIEAIGAKQLNTFVKKCNALLRPQGLIFLQAITINDQRYEIARKTYDFIKLYIFPGGWLPSLEILLQAFRRHTNLLLRDIEMIGPHYVRTLEHWANNCNKHHGALEALGYDQKFMRLWHFYLAYCQGGFSSGYINNIQLVMSKNEC